MIQLLTLLSLLLKLQLTWTSLLVPRSDIRYLFDYDDIWEHIEFSLRSVICFEQIRVAHIICLFGRVGPLIILRISKIIAPNEFVERSVISRNTEGGSALFPFPSFFFGISGRIVSVAVASSKYIRHSQQDTMGERDLPWSGWQRRLCCVSLLQPTSRHRIQWGGSSHSFSSDTHQNVLALLHTFVWFSTPHKTNHQAKEESYVENAVRYDSNSCKTNGQISDSSLRCDRKHFRPRIFPSFIICASDMAHFDPSSHTARA